MKKLDLSGIDNKLPEELEFVEMMRGRLRGERRKLYQIFYFLLEMYVGLGEYNNPGQYEENKEHLWNMVKSIH